MTPSHVGSNSFDHQQTAPRQKTGRLTRCLALITGLILLQAIPARADTANEFQQWSLIFVNHHLDNKWSASMQVENRLRFLLTDTDIAGRKCIC